MNRGVSISLITILLVLGGCTSSKSAKKSYKDTSKQSPSNFYNAGMLRCSANNPTFDDVCDYAVYYENKVMKIIIENSSVSDSIVYRIFYFSGGKFKTKKKKEVVRSHKLASNHYQIRVASEYYLIPFRALTYQPMEDDNSSKEKPKIVEVKAKPIVSVAEVVEEPIVAPKEVIKPIVKPTPTVAGTSRKFRR